MIAASAVPAWTASRAPRFDARVYHAHTHTHGGQVHTHWHAHSVGTSEPEPGSGNDHHEIIDDLVTDAPAVPRLDAPAAPRCDGLVLWLVANRGAFHDGVRPVLAREKPPPRFALCPSNLRELRSVILLT